MCQKENDILATIYFLMRSLACELPHEASREFLFDYFEEIRLKYVAVQSPKKEKKKHRSKIEQKGDEKVFLNFILCLFRIQGILYTKIGTDELEKLYDRQFDLLKAYLD